MAARHEQPAADAGPRTELGIPVEPLYDGHDLAPGLEERLGVPGRYPFTRGIYSEMYRKAPWRMRQYAGYGTVAETRRRWATLLASGQNGISCAFDLATQLGYDSDDPEALPEVGKLGVAIDTLPDMIELFDGLPLDEVAATFNINAAAPIIYAMFLATARRQGGDMARVTGTLSNDPLIEFIARGLWRLPPAASMRMVADVFEASLRNTPAFYPINIRGCLTYEAGASDEQEIAFTLSCALEYMRALRARGVDLNEAGIRFSFMMFADHNIVEQVAKFRAARRMWARLCRDELGITREGAMRFRFTAPVGSYNFKAQQPELNIIRAAYGALAGVLGGCQAMLVAGYDEAFAIPTEATALLGLRTQQILAEEVGVTKTPDPLGGSYYLESLTDAVEERATSWLSRIEEAGGMVAAIERGIPQQAIADRAYETEMAIEEGRKRVVGLNCYEDPGDDPQSRLEFHAPDDAPVKAQLARLAAHRAGRSGTEVAAAIDRVKSAISGEVNVVEPMHDALVAGATIGELTRAMSEVCGEHREYVRY